MIHLYFIMYLLYANIVKEMSSEYAEGIFKRISRTSKSNKFNMRVMRIIMRIIMGGEIGLFYKHQFSNRRGLIPVERLIKVYSRREFLCRQFTVNF